MLEVRGLEVSYGAVRAVQGLDLDVVPGTAVGLLGANGAGKSSTLRAISRLVPSRGTVRFDGEDLARRSPDAVARLGLLHVPEGRHIFATLDVEENLHVGQAARSGRPVTFSIDDAYDLFPALRPLRHRAGWALSGGEQQMLAVARALVGSPRLLLLDEPSLGLAPLVARTVFDALLEVRDRVPLLVVEQNTDLALRICTRVHVLSEGRTVLAGAPDELGDRSALLASYLGQGGTPVAEHLAPEQP